MRVISNASAIVVALGLAGSPASAELMEGRTDDGYAFVIGGIGDAEQQTLKRIAEDYSLQIVMANQSGAYIADNAVHIRDQQGNVVLSGRVDAPWVMVDVPPGRYMVEAQYEGREIRRQVDVPATGSRRVVLHFKP